MWSEGGGVMPETMYVLMITWARIETPLLLPATIEACKYEAMESFDVRPAGISTSKEKLQERANDLKEYFSFSFVGYQIFEVGVFE